MAAKKQKKKKIDVSSIPKPGDVMEKKSEIKKTKEAAEPKTAKKINKKDVTPSLQSTGSTPVTESLEGDSGDTINLGSEANDTAVSEAGSGTSVPQSTVEKATPEAKAAPAPVPSPKLSPKKDEKKEVEGFGIKPREDDEESDVIPLERSNKRLYIASIIVFILVVGTALATFFYRTRLNTESSEVAEEVVAEEVAEEEDLDFEDIEVDVGTASGALARGEIALEILNGSGVAGLAASVSAQFEDLGYVIEDTGNAARQEANTLEIISTRSAELKLLKDDVENLLKITDTEELEDGEGILGRIILGAP